MLRVISPLAEGTDRIAAKAAIGLGYELQCPMPFLQEEFEKDFAPGAALEPNSLATFRELLAGDETEARPVTFELDGSHERAGAAYGACGRIVLNQSDILLVVWDEKEAAGAGGTVQTLQEALAYHVPVVWIDAIAPHPWQLLSPANALACAIGPSRCVPAPASAELERDELRQRVEAALTPPGLSDSTPRLTSIGRLVASIKAPMSGHAELVEPDLRETFFGERKPALNWWLFWKFFRDLVGSHRFRLQPLRIKDFEEAIADEWPERSPLRAYYAWPDKLADIYADAYRSSFLLIYLLGATAVLFALVSTVTEEILVELSSFLSKFLDRMPRDFFSLETWCIGLELIVILVIVFFIMWGRNRRWHHRWMQYRLIAELVRQLRFLSPLGGGRPFPRLPVRGHLGAYGNPAETWMYWHVRAIEREIGLPRAKLTQDYLNRYLDFLQKLVDGQIGFHLTNKDRSRNISHRLHVWGICLFLATGSLCFVHFLPRFLVLIDSMSASRGAALSSHWTEFASKYPTLAELVPNSLTLLAAVLPAFGAALAGIREQGEFLRVSKRSLAMHDRLVQFKEQLESLRKPKNPGDPPPMLESGPVIEIAISVIQLMVDEVLDWRVVFQDRPLETPA